MKPITRQIYPIFTLLLELANLVTLRAGSKGIADLSGLEYCTNLTQLSLEENQISDISQLINLTSLTELWLSENQISDIFPLSSLINLTALDLNKNPIGDISGLVENSGLGAGDKVWLEHNNLDLSEGSEDMENIKALEARGVIVDIR